MLKKLGVVCVVFLAVCLAAGADTASAPATLSAAEIVQRNVMARGGLQAWRKVQTLTMKGTMEAGGNNRPTLAVPGVKPAQVPAQRLKEQVQLPFVLELKRPRKMRLELQFAGQTAIQVYDGTHGWKLRPFLNRHQVEPFTAEETTAASLQADLDGYLVDYATKGTTIELEGIEKVEDRDAYKLKLTLKTGHVLHIWVDAQTFLETKAEGLPRRLDGKEHAVAIHFRDYHPVDGLMVPYLFETSVEGVSQTEKIRIESVVIGPKLDDSRFAKLE